MTLAQIMKLALRQLDEDIEDINDHEELFRAYANMGNQIIMKNFYQPREIVMLRSNDDGVVYIDGMGIDRVLTLTDAYGRTHPFEMAADGTHLTISEGNTELSAVCQMRAAQLVEDSDEPRFPEEEHFALVDYICYRALAKGNAAKQQRSMVFHSNFVQACQRISPAGAGSVTRMRNLYAASSIHKR